MLLTKIVVSYVNKMKGEITYVILSGGQQTIKG